MGHPLEPADIGAQLQVGKVHFLAICREEILPAPTGAVNPMTLLLDTDCDKATGWEGYDFKITGGVLCHRSSIPARVITVVMMPIRVASLRFTRNFMIKIPPYCRMNVESILSQGLYIATPETYVLTHTSQQAIGITTRSGESLELFRNTILAQEQLTNSGIMKSPGTGSMILSMYYPIFEEGDCIGYVGAGVYADRLMDVLLGLDIQGLPGSEYVFLNVETGVYLYHENEELLNRKGLGCPGA